MATKKELLLKSQHAVVSYFELSKFLLGEDAPYNINEISKDDMYYPVAKEMCDEVGVDWDKMTHEESNRIILNLLSEYFLDIQSTEDYNITLTIAFEKKK